MLHSVQRSSSGPNLAACPEAVETGGMKRPRHGFATTSATEVPRRLLHCDVSRHRCPPSTSTTELVAKPSSIKNRTAWAMLETIHQRRSVRDVLRRDLASITLGPGHKGYCELKKNPTWLATARPQPPTICFDDRVANCQSHVHAIGLGRLEGIKQAPETLAAQPWAGVSNADAHAVLFDRLCADLQISLAAGNAAHRLNRVNNQF